jgi:opacity protein-like surface antigen
MIADELLSSGERAMRMRWLICGVAAAVSVEANAADMGEMLRGSNTVIAAPGGTRWDGFYVGGQVGLNYSGTDFSSATRSLTALMLRNTVLEHEFHPSDWAVLGKGDTSGVSYGAFIGYQTEWETAVIGLEANYNRTNLSVSATDSIARTVATTDGFLNSVRIDGASSIHITDYGTLRVRGGWAAGSFMPYGFVGVALGRADVSRSGRVIATGFNAEQNRGYNFNQTATEAKNGDFAYGYAAGLGIDMCITQNIFVRGEYEYVKFGEFNDLNTHIHTVRAAAGFKF